MYKCTFLNVVVREGSAILQLLPSKYQSLLVRWNTFFVLYLGLDILYGVRGLHLKRDGLTRQCLDEDLHLPVTGRFMKMVNKIQKTENNDSAYPYTFSWS